MDDLWMAEDITFCTKYSCECMECYRNPNRIKLRIPHSFSELEGTELCYLEKQRKYDYGEQAY